MTMKLYIHQGVFKILKHSLMYFINRGVPASIENRQSVVKLEFPFSLHTGVCVRVGSKQMEYPIKLSRPCPSCEKAIKQSGLKKIFYSA